MAKRIIAGLALAGIGFMGAQAAYENVEKIEAQKHADANRVDPEAIIAQDTRYATEVYGNHAEEVKKYGADCVNKVIQLTWDPAYKAKDWSDYLPQAGASLKVQDACGTGTVESSELFAFLNQSGRFLAQHAERMDSMVSFKEAVADARADDGKIGVGDLLKTSDTVNFYRQTFAWRLYTEEKVKNVSLFDWSDQNHNRFGALFSGAVGLAGLAVAVSGTRRKIMDQAEPLTGTVATDYYSGVGYGRASLDGEI